MLAVKARFSNDENLIEHVTQFVDKRLRKEGLPEDFLSWYPGWNFADADGNLPDTLSCFGIYNVKMGYGFFAY